MIEPVSGLPTDGHFVSLCLNMRDVCDVTGNTGEGGGAVSVAASITPEAEAVG
jgi:hypothetical protein